MMCCERRSENDIKIRFELKILEDGFPPIGLETLNANLIGNNIAKLDNTPFFADSVAVGDIISCNETGHDHILQFDRVITPSGHKSISIIFIDDDCKEEIYQYFKGCDCYCEYGEFDGFNMLAVSIDKELDYSKIVSYLGENEVSGRISYAGLPRVC